LGLPDNGENGQGIAIKMMIMEMENQTSIVLNFSLSVDLRFDNADPIVNTTIAVSINIMCIKP
jgi:hypothetical protein